MLKLDIGDDGISPKTTCGIQRPPSPTSTTPIQTGVSKDHKGGAVITSNQVASSPALPAALQIVAIQHYA